MGTRAIKKVGMFDAKDTIAAKVPLSEMVIDDYQGHVNKGLVNKMAKKWDESAAGAVILNLRDDDTYAVLDGQHRVLAAKQVGVGELNALVFIGKTKQEEANLFVQLNTKHNVSSMDRFRANLIAGGIREKTIRSAVREVGLDISLDKHRRPDTLSCAAALTSIYDNFGLPLLKTSLGVLTSAFHSYPDRHKAYSQSAIIGTAQFLYRYPKADVTRLIEKLKTKSPTVLVGMGEAKLDAHSDLWVGWAKILVTMYNTGLSSRKEAYLPPEIMEGKKYSPAALARVKSPEAKAKREKSLALAREASRKRMLDINERRRQKKVEQAIDVTIGKQKPLSSRMLAAAKSEKK